MDDLYNVVSGLFAIGGIIIALCIILLIVYYIFKSIGLYKMAVTNGYDNIAFLAWIPVVNNYLLGAIGGEANIFGALKLQGNILGTVLTVVNLLLYGFIDSGFFSVVLVCIYVILCYYAYFDIYRKIDFKNSKIFAVFSIFIPLFAIIYIFIKREHVFYSTGNNR